MRVRLVVSHLFTDMLEVDLICEQCALQRKDHVYWYRSVSCLPYDCSRVVATVSYLQQTCRVLRFLYVTKHVCGLTCVPTVLKFTKKTYLVHDYEFRASYV